MLAPNCHLKVTLLFYAQNLHFIQIFEYVSSLCFVMRLLYFFMIYELLFFLATVRLYTYLMSYVFNVLQGEREYWITQMNVFRFMVTRNLDNIFW